MDASLLQPVLDWIGQHPTWSGLIVFSIALSESLAVVGLFMPGAVLLFGIGALVATGAFPLLDALLWAAAGAIAGDGLSFWLGRHFQGRLREIWPFARYPALFARGEAFFLHHGGKSVLIGRFVGPIRPIVPAIAGMLGMSAPRFFTINVLSAFAWAPAYLLPGYVFGASLGLASQVASRLVVLLLVLIAALWLAIWLSYRLYRLLLPHANALVDGLLRWGYAHPRIGRLARAVADPQHPEFRGLLTMAAVLVVMVWAFVGILGRLLSGAPLAIDEAVFHVMRGLRTPWADQFMVLVTELGGVAVSLSVAGAVLGYLIWRRSGFAVAHWLAAVAFGAAVPLLLKSAIQLPRPQALYSGAVTYAFPSWHVTMSTVLYGFLAVMLARELPAARRWLPYAAAGAFVTLIALSRLYLGVHWLSDVLGGFALGTAWVALLGIAYRQHLVAALQVRGLLLVTLAGLALAGSGFAARHFDADLQRFALQQPRQALAAQGWWAQGWRDLPAYRLDLEGGREQPLTVQWLGELAALREQLERQGWRAPVELSPASTLLWLLPEPRLAELPLLPQVHDGFHEALRLVHDDGRADAGPLVLRLWRSDRHIVGAAGELWIGYVGRLVLGHPLPLVFAPRTGSEFDQPLQALAGALDGWQLRRVQRAVEQSAPWGGSVLLIRPAGAGDEQR